ncbi:DUF6879 family protein [Pilimelia anulata]|uniref:DUF6879 family protein n=1 Tax=Pilimelia anulata TaxID=53371 RepID=UPI00357171DD
MDRAEFVRRYSSVRRSWAHMELRDFYGVPGDAEPFARWRRGELTDLSYHDGWASLVSAG